MNEVRKVRRDKYRHAQRGEDGLVEDVEELAMKLGRREAE